LDAQKGYQKATLTAHSSVPAMVPKTAAETADATGERKGQQWAADERAATMVTETGDCSVKSTAPVKVGLSVACWEHELAGQKAP
jgi:hypothetical protein